MQKVNLPEREGWRDEAKELGFTFADMHGEPYWDESSVYQFNLREIEDDIEDPSTEIHAMCREATAAIVASQELMEKLGIPDAFCDLVADSWTRQQPEIYGRLDLAYGGSGPAKLLEYNADTPTSLYESASFQWLWLERQIEAGVLDSSDDQFNGIHEALVERFRATFEAGTDLHFTAVANTPEDYATVECMGWAAREAGLGAHYCDLEKIGLSAEGQFLDYEDRVIATLFKLYPWEDLFSDSYGARLGDSGCLLLEPAWKAVVSNKGILPVLWQMFEGHPNLLPSFFEQDVTEALSGRGPASETARAAFESAGEAFSRGYVRKPLFSREGASLSIIRDGEVIEQSESKAYDAHPRIVQSYQALPEFDGFRPVIGAWIVGETCVGMGMREDRSRITQDLSRFKPHFIRQ